MRNHIQRQLIFLCSLIVAACCYLVPVGAAAQNKTSRFNWGISLGPEVTWAAKADSRLSSSIVSPGLGFEFLGFGTFNFAKHVALQAGVGMSLQSYKNEGIAFYVSQNPVFLNTSHHDLAFRAACFLRFNLQSPDEGWFFTLGPELTKVYIPTTTSTMINNGQEGPTIISNPNWHRLSAALQFSMGYKHRFDDRIHLSFEPFFRLPQSRWVQFGDRVHHLSAGLRVGAWF